MNISRYLRQRTKVIVLTAAHLLITKASANAIDVTFGASVGEVHNVPATNGINEASIPDGFDNGDGNEFFTSNFLLLGADSESTSISSDSYAIGPSTAISTNTNIVFSEQQVAQDIELKFDWIFQGNSNGVLIFEENLDLFTIAFAQAGAVSTDPDDGLILNSSIYTFTTNEYGSGTVTHTIPADTLVADIDYVVAADLLELDVPLPIVNIDGDSAAGLGNVTINAVPFEFSPTLGLLAVGGFWGLSKLKLWQRLGK